jgi:hypothetical protein
VVATQRQSHLARAAWDAQASSNALVIPWRRQQELLHGLRGESCLDVVEAELRHHRLSLVDTNVVQLRDCRELQFPLSHLRTLDSRALRPARAPSKCDVNIADMVALGAL